MHVYVCEIRRWKGLSACMTAGGSQAGAVCLAQVCAPRSSCGFSESVHMSALVGGCSCVYVYTRAHMCACLPACVRMRAPVRRASEVTTFPLRK